MTDGEIRANISSNLCEIMGFAENHDNRKLKITLNELAQKTGINKGTLRHAKYHGIVSLCNLVKIAEVLNVPIERLVNYSSK